MDKEDRKEIIREPEKSGRTDVRGKDRARTGENTVSVESDIERMKKEMEEHHGEIVCRELIWDLIPEINEMNQRLSEEGGHPVMDNLIWRVKSPESIVKKLRRKGKEVSYESALLELSDLAGIRVVCFFQDDVYRMAKAIRKIPGIHIVKEKNYIAHPKDSGYRSIHIILEMLHNEDKIRVEIQIRSVAMNYWAILDHQLSYKNEKKGMEKLRKELKSYAIAIAKIDKKFLKLRKRIEKL